jgi:hypothetical protein
LAYDQGAQAGVGDAVDVRATFSSVGGSIMTYDYTRSRLLPAAKFQVHCQKGIVISVEQFDD